MARERLGGSGCAAAKQRPRSPGQQCFAGPSERVEVCGPSERASERADRRFARPQIVRYRANNLGPTYGSSVRHPNAPSHGDGGLVKGARALAASRPRCSRFAAAKGPQNARTAPDKSWPQGNPPCCDAHGPGWEPACLPGLRVDAYRVRRAWRRPRTARCCRICGRQRAAAMQ